MAQLGAEGFVPLALAAAHATNACDTELDLEGLLFCPPRAWGSGLGPSASQKKSKCVLQHYSHRHSAFAYLQVWPLISYSNESMGTLCQRWPSAGPINV